LLSESPPPQVGYWQIDLCADALASVAVTVSGINSAAEVLLRHEGQNLHDVVDASHFLLSPLFFQRLASAQAL
jgi:hypothetical protein